ncbi:MAG: roadblock/LC7 domain-containing protein [Promethearchaeota archaeon]
MSTLKIIKDEEIDDKKSYLDSLRKILKKLLFIIPEVRMAAILSQDGLPIASTLSHDIDETQIAALTASILCMAEKTSLKLRAGFLEQICIHCSDRNLLILTAGQNAILTVSTTKNVNIDLIFLGCRKICEEIASIV